MLLQPPPLDISGLLLVRPLQDAVVGTMEPLLFSNLEDKDKLRFKSLFTRKGFSSQLNEILKSSLNAIFWVKEVNYLSNILIQIWRLHIFNLISLYNHYTLIFSSSKM